MADNKQRCEKKLDKILSENLKKTPEKKLVQLSLHKVPDSVRNTVVSDKAASKKQKRTESSDMDSPLGAPPGTPGISGELKSIQETLSNIQENMVKKTEIKTIMTSFLEEMKKEFRQEIITDVKNSILKEIKEETTNDIKTAVKNEFEQKIENEISECKKEIKERCDGFNLDLENLREKFNAQAQSIRQMRESLNSLQYMAGNALTLANQTQQYSQKSNIKFLQWNETQNENLWDMLCRIMKETVNVDLSPADILAIDRVPGGGRGAPRPVIAKFCNTDTKIRIIKNRFIMQDHLTPLNAKLIRDLKDDSRIHPTWYYNGKVFALDNEGNRHKFDILDDITEKLKQRR